MGRDGYRNRLEGKYNNKTYKKDNVIVMKREKIRQRALQTNLQIGSNERFRKCRNIVIYNFNVTCRKIISKKEK